MIDSLLNLLLCSHRKLSFPITTVCGEDSFQCEPNVKKTYVVCLACGKKFTYNWDQLRIEPAEIKSKPQLIHSAARQVVHWAARLRDFQAVGK